MSQRSECYSDAGYGAQCPKVDTVRLAPGWNPWCPAVVRSHLSRLIEQRLQVWDVCKVVPVAGDEREAMLKRSRRDQQV